MSLLEGLINFCAGYYFGHQNQKRNNEVQMQIWHNEQAQERIKQLELELSNLRQGLYYHEVKKP